MPDASNRRQHRRFPIPLPLVYTLDKPAPNGGGIGWTRDLGEGGACLELAERLQPPAPLQLRLRTDRGAIEVGATVAWTAKTLLPDGGILHGVTFIHIAPSHVQALQELLLSKGLLRPTKVRVPIEVPVTCRLKGMGGVTLEGRTQDMSRGGLLLRLPRVVPPGTAVGLSLHTAPESLSLEGRVIWVAPPEGRTPGGPIPHGVELKSPGWASELGLARSLL